MSARNRLRKSEEPFVEFLHAVEKALAYSEITATLEAWEGKVMNPQLKQAGFLGVPR